MRASASHGTQVVLVHGEPGIGKTALASWLIAEAEASGALVVQGRAPSVGGAPPYWPWTEALRSLIEARPAILATLTPSDVGVLARLVPWLGDSAAPTSALPPAFMFDAVSRLLATVSADAPLVVILDDLHWADDGTLDLFHFAATSRARSHLLLVGIARADVEPNHPLRAHVASLASQPQVSHLGLSGLDSDEVAELISEVTGSRPERQLAEVLRDRTGGNPFFIREVLRVATDDSGRFDLSRVAVPDSVRDVIRGRVVRLGPDAPAVFTVLSFARDAFTTVLADHLVEIGPERVMDVVDAGLAAGLLIDAPGRPGFYRFAHSLVRHVFYNGLPAARRAEMHLRVGRVLEQVAPRPMEIANELAWHYSHAATVGGAADAVRWERVAAERACRSFAYQDAVHHLRRALASVRKVLRDDALEHEVLSELATAAHAAGDTHTAAVAEQRMKSLR